MVHARALEGSDVSYLRPERAVLPVLQQSCPEVLDDLNLVFAGAQAPTVALVEESLSGLQRFRELVLDVLQRRGGLPLTVPSWTPYVSPVSSPEAPCQT
jgi:hypothetical protein